TNGPYPAVAPTSEEDGVRGRPFTGGRARGPVSGTPPEFQRDRMLAIRLIVAARAGPHACRKMAGQPRELLPNPLNGGPRALGTAEQAPSAAVSATRSRRDPGGWEQLRHRPRGARAMAARAPRGCHLLVDSYSPQRESDGMVPAFDVCPATHCTPVIGEAEQAPGTPTPRTKPAGALTPASHCAMNADTWSGLPVYWKQPVSEVNNTVGTR